MEECGHQDRIRSKYREPIIWKDFFGGKICLGENELLICLACAIERWPNPLIRMEYFDHEVGEWGYIDHGIAFEPQDKVDQRWAWRFLPR